MCLNIVFCFRSWSKWQYHTIKAEIHHLKLPHWLYSQQRNDRNAESSALCAMNHPGRECLRNRGRQYRGDLI